MRRDKAAAGVVLPAELGCDHDALRTGADRLREQLVRNVRAVVPGGVEDPHAELERSAQDAAGFGDVRRRAEHAGPGQAHRAVAQTGHECPVELDEVAAGRAHITTIR